jgi:hypothetical protein
MKELIEAITKFVPLIQSSPLWMKAYFVLWLFASVGLVSLVIFFLGSDYKVAAGEGSKATNEGQKIDAAAPITPLAVTWPITGDSQIDEAHKSLNTLAATPNPTEGQLVSALRNVFYKPIFKHVYEEDDPGRALFTFCRAQILLQNYVNKFNSPDVRRKILDAIQNLISLQDQFAQLYGPTFQRGQQCTSYSNSLAEYMSKLPPRQQNQLEGSQFDKGMRVLEQLRNELKYVNLMD